MTGSADGDTASVTAVFKVKGKTMGIESVSGFEKEISENISGIETMEDGVIIEHLTAPREGNEFTEEQSDLFGDPGKDALVWSREPDIALSGLMCQKYAAEQLLERALTRQDLIAAAEKNGWYGRETGIAFSDVGKLLSELGLSVEQEQELTLKELCEMLYCGEKVICPVSSILLAYPELIGFPGLSADLMVEVIGVELAREEPKVIVNDPTAEKGGTEHMLKVFLEAWRAGRCRAVSVGAGGRHGF